MKARTISHQQAMALIDQKADPPPFRSLTQEGVDVLNGWVQRVAKEPHLQDPFLWQVQASTAANAGGPGEVAVLEMSGPMTKTGKTETLLLSRQMFFWQVMRE